MSTKSARTRRQTWALGVAAPAGFWTRRFPLLAYIAEFYPYRRDVAKAFALAIAKHSPVVVLPLYTGYILDRVVPARDLTALAFCAVGMIAMIVINVTLHPLYIRLWSTARRRVAQQIRMRLMERIQQIVFVFHDTSRAGRLHNKIMSDVEKLDLFGQLLIEGMAVPLSSTIVALTVICWLHPEFLLVVAVFLPIVLLQQVILSRPVQRRFATLRTQTERLNAEASEMLGMLTLSRAHATEAEDLRRLEYRLAGVRVQGVRTDWVYNVLGSQIWGTSQLVSISVVVLGAWLCITGGMTVGTVVMFMSFVGMTIGSIAGLLSQLDKIYQAKDAILSIQEILHHPEVEANDGKRPLENVRGDVIFRNVSFAYKGGATALREVNVDIRAEQTIALVGPSGAGKSTFVKLLLGFYLPTTGSILIDGQPLDQINLHTLRRRVGIVTQDTFLFNGTVLENLTHGLIDVPLERVQDAARQANAEAFIEALPQGYRTPIGDRGLKLSGGQKQRLAIARALLRQPRILLLDEATSALDSESEHVVQEALNVLMKGRTTFVIAHRLSTIRDADRILVFEGGRIVEDGTHDSLLTSGGLYARLVRMQRLEPSTA